MSDERRWWIGERETAAQPIAMPRTDRYYSAPSGLWVVAMDIEGQIEGIRAVVVGGIFSLD